MGEWLLSRRDSTIVARHEVPGIMRKIALSQGDVNRSQLRSDASNKHLVKQCFSKSSRFDDSSPSQSSS
jgi:hypothetical protein